MDSVTPCWSVPMVWEGGSSFDKLGATLTLHLFRQFTYSGRSVGYGWLHWICGGLLSADEGCPAWRAMGLASKRRLRGAIGQDSAIFLGKRGQQYVMPEPLTWSGMLRPAVWVSEDVHDACGLQKCIIRSFPSYLEESTGGRWVRQVHLRYNLLSKCLEILFWKLQSVNKEFTAHTRS